MGDLYWIGGATAVAQEDRFTPANTIEVGDEFKITLNDKDGVNGGGTVIITAIATGTSVASVCADMLAAWNASTSPLKSGITASDQTTYFRLVGTAGIPFYATSATTESGGGASDSQTFTRTATTANAGPVDWGTAANWSSGAVPVNSDNVTLDSRGSNYAIRHGLDQSAVTLGNLHVDLSYLSDIGTTRYALAISAAVARIGKAPTDGSNATGSACINLNFGSTAVQIDMLGSRNQGTGGLPPVNVRASHASDNKLFMSGGILGLAAFVPGESATLTTNSVTGGTLVCGSGLTWGTITNNGGVVYVNSAGTTYSQNKGTLFTEGTGLIGTMTAIGGNLFVNHRTTSSNSITTLNLRGGNVDLRGNQRALTIGTANLRTGSLRTFSTGQLTITAATLDQDVNTFFNLTASPTG